MKQLYCERMQYKEVNKNKSVTGETVTACFSKRVNIRLTKPVYHVITLLWGLGWIRQNSFHTKNEFTLILGCSVVGHEFNRKKTKTFEGVLLPSRVKVVEKCLPVLCYKKKV